MTILNQPAQWSEWDLRAKRVLNNDQYLNGGGTFGFFKASHETLKNN